MIQAPQWANAIGHTPTRFQISPLETDEESVRCVSERKSTVDLTESYDSTATKAVVCGLHGGVNRDYSRGKQPLLEIQR